MAVLLLVLGSAGGSALAQGIAPGRVGPDPGLVPMVPPWQGGRPAPFSPGVRRVQAEMPPAPQPELPSAATTPAPGDAPVRNEEDISLPRAEREGGGGGPTEAQSQQTPAAEGEAEEEEKPEPTLLMKALGMEDSPVKIYGWIQNSYTGNTNGRPPSGINFGVNPNNLANRWMGNQYYLIVENPLEQNDKVNFGFRADNLFGNDAQFNHSTGFADNAFRPNSFRQYDLAQLYGEVHLPFLTKGGIDVKGGRWYTLAGYEVVPAIGRPLLSVPYMFNYGQPFTHVGVLTTTHLTDRINLYNGAINGWDRWINVRYKWGYIGGFSWSSEDGKTSLAFTTVWGPNQYPNFLSPNLFPFPTGVTTNPAFVGRRNFGYGDNTRVLFTTVLSHKWTDKLTQVIETDQAHEQNVPFLAANGGPQSAEWYSFGNWFLYAFNDKLTGVWRSEVFRDDDGVRTGTADTFYEMTLGMIYKPKSWLWIRPEARYDWAQFKNPYNDGTRGSQLTLAIDAILLY
jgi:hypothetical protein